MQDPSSSAYYQAMMKQPQLPEQEQLKCPRCDSTKTKFCYYNNYNLSQPRHFCKSCRRYWTKGGALRNIPVGGSSRKSTKRSGSSGNPKKTRLVRISDPDPTRMIQDSGSAAESRQSGSYPYQSQDPTRVSGLSGDDHEMKVLDMGGSFSSLLACNMQLGGILDELNENGSGLKPVQTVEFRQNFCLDHRSDRNSGQDPGISIRGGGGGGEAFCWNGCGNGCPDLAINTSGSSFQ